MDYGIIESIMNIRPTKADMRDSILDRAIYCTILFQVKITFTF